jgi:type II secretory pathway component PulF
MPIFRYKARDKYGALFTGEIDAIVKEAVAAQLDSLGYIPVFIEEQKVDLFSSDFFENLATYLQPITLQDLIIFTRQLATLVAAGLPFITSFDALIQQTENKRFKNIITQIRSDVEAGRSFSEALAKHPKVFNDLYVNMVKAGEVGGVLDEMLDRLASLAEHEAETRARIKAATRYPKIVIVALGVAIVILMTFVVPRFAALYANFHAQLPLPTRILIAVSNFSQHYWYWAVGFVVLALIGFKNYINTQKGRLQWDGFKLKVPIFGEIFLKAALSRFTRVFATLNRSGLPILQTLEIVAKTVNNVIISRVIDNIRDSARQGRGLVQPMRVSGIFPPVVIHMVGIGEETGKLDEMLMKVSQYYDRDVDYSIRNLSTTLEPLLLTLIGGVILFLALAIFMPWWNMINVFKSGGG